MNKLTKLMLASVMMITSGFAGTTPMEVTLPTVEAGTTLIINKDVKLTRTLENKGTITSEVGGDDKPAVSGDAGVEIKNIVTVTMTDWDETGDAEKFKTIGGKVKGGSYKKLTYDSGTVTNLDTDEIGVTIDDAVLEMNLSNNGSGNAGGYNGFLDVGRWDVSKGITLDVSNARDVCWNLTDLDLVDGENFKVRIVGGGEWQGKFDWLKHSSLNLENAETTNFTINTLGVENCFTASLNSDGHSNLTLSNATYAGSAELKGKATFKNVVIEGATADVTILGPSCTFDSDCYLKNGATLRIGANPNGE